MAVINDLIDRISDPELRRRINDEVARLQQKKKFGLVFEEHLPEATPLYEVPIKVKSLVARKDGYFKEFFRVKRIEGETLFCEREDDSHEQVELQKNEAVAVALFGQPIYPYLKPMDAVKNAPDSKLWHTLIEADNYHALQLLVYLYGGMVDCIYIDPPYNTGAKDWKYNNDYVEATDSYRHSKWLSMIKKRLLLAKKLLNPKDSVLIVTIDEKEYSRLGCLLEELFPEARIQMISSVINHAGNGRQDDFCRTNEFIYILMFGNCIVTPLDDKVATNNEVVWDTLRRHNPASIRPARPSQFYPIYVNISTGKIEKIGEPITPDVNRFSVPSIEGCATVFPVKDNGIEMMWGVVPDECRRRWENGFINVGKYNPSKPQQFPLRMLSSGTINDIKTGKAIVLGHRDDGSVIAIHPNGKKVLPKSQWDKELHDARYFGTDLLRLFIGSRFDFPKSLYAVHDTLKLFVDNKPNALILDFFAGSGTTLHAVNLLNKEDGGRRRCIMVTNNEIGEPKERELLPLGIHPGDDEWERWGIARYVNWPRTKSSIIGKDVNNNIIEGNYITSLTQVKESDRQFTQISFLPINATLKQKKSLLKLINKQKTVKLPTMSVDLAFLLSEDDKYNASILFDVTKIDEWIEALEGKGHITNFYIVTEKDNIYKRLKNDVSEQMGKFEETIPMEIPISEGFEANVKFFKLGFLDKNSVAAYRQFRELLPLLWMKAGAIGECPSLEGKGIPSFMILDENKMAIMTEESNYAVFLDQMKDRKDIKTIFLVVDSEIGFREMAAPFKWAKTYQLYKDYLENFTINYEK